MTTPALGDIFLIPLSDTSYVTGQVRLDVGSLIQERLLPPDSLLNAFRDTVLVDMFEGVTDRPVAGSGRQRLLGGFVGLEELKAGRWPIVQREDVDWRALGVPEYLLLSGSQPSLVMGEILFPIDISFDEMNAVNVYGSPIRAARLAGICAHYAGRDDLVEERIRGNVWQTSVKHKDLRNSEHRAMIFDRAGIDPASSYVEFAAQKGVDTGRLFGEPQQAFIGCPYCMVPISEDTTDCPTCKKDTRLDAPTEFTAIEALTAPRRSCIHCGASIMTFASICAACGHST